MAASAAGAFFASAPLQTFAIFLKPVTDEFGWSREAGALAYGAMTLAAAFSAPWLGLLLDRLGTRQVILPCLAISGAAVASLSLMTPALWHFYLVCGVIGLVTIGTSPVAYSRVLFGWFDRHRGRALGLMLAGAATAAIILPPILQRVVQSAGWRVAWLGLGCASLSLGLPAVVRYVRERGVEDPRYAAGAGARVRDALATRVFWTLVVVVFGSTLAMNGAFVHMAALLSDRGLSASDGAIAISAMGAASLAGRLGTGWLLDRFQPARVSVVLLVIAALGTFLLSGAEIFAVAVAAAVCIGFGTGGEIDVTPYLLSRYFGLRSLSTLYGLNWTAWGLAGAIGPVAMGRAFDSTGSYASVLVAFSLVTLVMASLMLTLPHLERSRVEVRVSTSAG